MILAMPYLNNRKVEFFPNKGVTREVGVDSAAHVSGTAHFVEGHCVCLYAEKGALYLQIDGARWLFNERLRLSYEHDVPSKTTSLSVADDANSVLLTYPSWWSGLGPDLLALPEMDEDQDYLAYVVNVWRNDSLQNNLLAVWEG